MSVLYAFTPEISGIFGRMKSAPGLHKILTIFVNILKFITELKRLLEHLLMCVQRKQWYNDVVPVVANGCVHDRENGCVFVVPAKPLFINTIHERMMKRKDWIIGC